MTRKEMSTIAKLKDSFLDQKRRSKSEEVFIKRHEEVREQEVAVDIRNEEEELASTIRRLEADIEYEDRVTVEMESFLRDQHQVIEHRVVVTHSYAYLTAINLVTVFS